MTLDCANTYRFAAYVMEPDGLVVLTAMQDAMAETINIKGHRDDVRRFATQLLAACDAETNA